MHFINSQAVKVIDVIAPEVEWIDQTTIKVMTPDFMAYGPKECTVRIAINEGDISVTSTNFLYFPNTCAARSLAYGPALLGEQLVGVPTTFVIHTRTDENKDRKYGMDEWKITCKKTNNSGETSLVDVIIDDKGNGKYYVSFTVDEPCTTDITCV